MSKTESAIQWMENHANNNVPSSGWKIMQTITHMAMTRDIAGERRETLTAPRQ